MDDLLCIVDSHEKHFVRLFWVSVLAMSHERRVFSGDFKTFDVVVNFARYLTGLFISFASRVEVIFAEVAADILEAIAHVVIAICKTEKPFRIKQ